MNENKEIKLNSIEATSYFWINVIRSKVRDVVINGVSNKKEIRFVEKFYYYTEKDWRNLYLELINYIDIDVNNYVSDANIGGINAFNQDTDIKGHDKLNSELSKIMKCSIPDIRLTSSFVKDSVIYTDMASVKVLYKSCGIRDLATSYDSTYVLTGDEEELNFYNSVVSTIAVLNREDKSFNSVPKLRNGFCVEYKKVNNLEDDLEQLEDKFNQVFEKCCDKGIILGRYWKGTYFCQIHDIDYVGLEPYMDSAKYYAKVILQENKLNDSKVYSKK